MNKRPNLATLAVALLLSAGLVACGGNAAPPASPVAVEAMPAANMELAESTGVLSSTMTQNAPSATTSAWDGAAQAIGGQPGLVLRTGAANPAPCYGDFAQVPASQFQSCFDYWGAKGMRPTTLTAYQEGSTIYFAGSFGAGGDRPTATLMTEQQFQQHFDTYYKQGYRPNSISVLSTANGPRFTVIWAPINGQAFESRSGLSAGEVYKKSQELSGFDIVEVAGYVENGALKHAAVWVKRPTMHTDPHLQMQSWFVANVDKKLIPQGFHLDRFSTAMLNGESRSAGIWSKAAGSWNNTFAENLNQLQSDYNTRTSQGYRIAQISTWFENGTKFWTIWRKP